MRTEATTADSPRDPLLGRGRELEELTGALHDALAGHGRLVMLGGEAGIGKTRLAEEAGARAIAKGAQVSWGRCWEGGGAPAYWPWIQVLRESLRSVYPDNQNADVARLFELLPDLTSAQHFTEARPAAEVSKAALPTAGTSATTKRRAFDSAIGDLDSARFRLFDAVSAVLKGRASMTPTMIVLDDLHAADIDSLLMLKFVARDIGHSRILVVGTRREIEVDSSPQHSAILSEVAREGHYVSLHGLSEADTASLISRHADIAVDDALLAPLYQATEGNPFFVDEIVRLMVVEGKFRRVGPIDTAFRIPNSVRAATRRRLSVLSADAVSALTIAATIGNEFNLATLVGVSGTPVERLIDALDQARRRDIVGEIPGIARRYRFTHAIVSESLRAELGMADSMRLHRRIAEELEQIYQIDYAPHCAELAHHFTKAIALGTADKALKYAREGAERAGEKFAYEEAVRLYQMALDAHSALSSSANAERCELLIALGDAQSKDGDRNRARKTFHDAAEIARGLKRNDLLARTALQASSGLGTFFVVDNELVALLEEASALITRDTAMRASLLACLAHELRWSDRRGYAIQLGSRAIEIARESNDAHALLSALWSEHDLSWAADNIEKRLAVADEIARLARQIGSTRWRLRAHETRISAMLEIGDVVAVDAEIQASEELRATAGQEFAVIERFRVTRTLMRGEFDNAETLINQLMRGAQRRQDMTLMMSFGGLLMMLRAEQGRLDELEASLKGPVARFPAMTVARCSLALFHVRTGRESEARAELEILARDEFGRISRDWNWLGSLAICAEVCSALGDASHAATLYSLLSDFAGRNVTIGWADICYGSVSRYLGLLASTMRRFDDAERHFQEAIRFELKMEAHPFVARTRACYAAMLIERGAISDHDQAREVLKSAVAAATVLKMNALARHATSVGARVSKATPTSTGEAREVGFAVAAEGAERRVFTIMFMDLVGSTEHAARVGDRQWNEVIDRFYAIVRDELKRFSGREIDTAGDGFFVLFSAPGHAIRCACEIRSALLKVGLAIRVGIHTGECEVSGDKVVGIAVHIGARLVREAAPGEVIVSATVKDLVVGAGIEFTNRGVHELRGIPGSWLLFAAKPT
jgi:predicted ATPase/class 3 adenylate cyclase